MLRRLVLPVLAIAGLTAGIAAAQGGSAAAEAQALLIAKRQAEQAMLRSQQLERESGKAIGEAAKARAAASAVAARIEAAEADLTAAETRIRIIEGLRARQRARLAERQEPVVRLTAALQTLARRPPALAMIQPGSIDDVVHVRSILASTLPIIRARTAGLRQEVNAGNALRKQAETARRALADGREELRKQRLAFARLEERQRLRSQELANSALSESDRALALGEEARDLTAMMSTREYQDRLRARLVQLPGPALRPGTDGGAKSPRPPIYILPVDGPIVTGTGEISPAGVHARGLTLMASANSEVVAPRDGKVVYAAPFRSYGRVLIIDHGGGWTSLITDLAALTVKPGDRVGMGEIVGRTGTREDPVTVELRRGGRPVPIAPLIARS
jgi:septal ring factor EnvC (AmiA/AmiB activator)